MTQVSSDNLRTYLTMLDAATNELNKAIDEEVRLNNELSLAKGEIRKKENSKKLIEQQIQCEKKLIDAAR